MAPTDSAVRYAEPGASWWLLLMGPVLGLLGALTQLSGDGRMQIAVWLVAALVITGFTAPIVAARRRHTAVEVTGGRARFGQEWIDLSEVAQAGQAPSEDAELARVLGGGYVVPRGTREVRLLLVDGTSVRGFARRPDRLRAALSAGS